MPILGIPDVVVVEWVDVHLELTVVVEVHISNEESTILPFEEEESSVPVGTEKVAVVATESHDLTLLPRETLQVLAESAEDSPERCVQNHLVDGNQRLLRRCAQLLTPCGVVDATRENVGGGSKRVCAVGLAELHRTIGENSLEATDDVLGELGECFLDRSLYRSTELVALSPHTLLIASVQYSRRRKLVNAFFDRLTRGGNSVVDDPFLLPRCDHGIGHVIILREMRLLGGCRHSFEKSRF